jgi:hypothetical protein
MQPDFNKTTPDLITAKLKAVFMMFLKREPVKPISALFRGQDTSEKYTHSPGNKNRQSEIKLISKALLPKVLRNLVGRLFKVRKLHFVYALVQMCRGLVEVPYYYVH